MTGPKGRSYVAGMGEFMPLFAGLGAVLVGIIAYKIWDERADAAVQLSPRDFEYSEFKPSKLKYILKFICGAFVVVIGLREADLGPQIMFCLIGALIIIWAASCAVDRVVVQDGVLSWYQGSTEKWRLPWGEIHHLTIVGLNRLDMAWVKTDDDRRRLLPMHIYKSNRKLRVMLENPVESWARAHGQV